MKGGWLMNNGFKHKIECSCYKKFKFKIICEMAVFGYFVTSNYV